MSRPPYKSAQPVCVRPSADLRRVIDAYCPYCGKRLNRSFYCRLWWACIYRRARRMLTREGSRKFVRSKAEVIRVTRL